VKIWTSILVAGAILALAVPSAFAASRQIPADPAGPSGYVLSGSGLQHLVKGGALGGTEAATIKKLRKQLAALTAKNKTLSAKNASLSSTNSAQLGQISALNEQIWILTGPHPAQQVDPDQECRDSQICTPEQDCRVWGNECDLAPSDDAATYARENG
jgi:hypothetical protein